MSLGMKHKTSVIITVLLVCVAFSLSAAVIPKNAVNVRLTFTAAFYSGKDGEKHYDSNYWVSTLTDIKAYREIWFTQLFESPAYADLYDKDRNFIETVPLGKYGETIHYILPLNARYIYLPVKREDLSKASLFGRRKAVNTISVGNEMTTINNAEEFPLENIITDGGFAKIFRTIGVIGDGIASGAMSTVFDEEEANQQNIEMFEYSWIQYMARYCGSTAYNFSDSGMNTSSLFTDPKYKEMFKELTDGKHLCQAYFIALGHSDFNMQMPIGSLSDIDPLDFNNNADTYIGNYARIISTIKAIQPNAKIFPVLMKNGETYSEYNKAIREVCTLFTENVYLLEMDQYSMERQDWEFTLGQGNTLGYLNYSYQISSYVDWYIRRYPDDFKYVQFIGTPYEYSFGLVKQ